MARESQTTARLEARLPPAFTEIIRLSVLDQRQIAEALLNPPEPTSALKKAYRQRRALLGVE